MQEDLRIIKKAYGENMMKLCRELFPSILEEKGQLPNILEFYFHKSKNLITDIVEQRKLEDFQSLIFSKFKKEKIQLTKSDKTPYELLKEAGYTLYKCNSEEEIQSFKCYYEKDEKLCTFNGNRLARSDVFFAVKDDIKKIKRSENPSRQDEYGTSVISIQFTLGNVNNVSIKNRYNHTVENPDATFNNQLDNIIAGLTDSFEKNFDYTINNSKETGLLELKNYVLGPDSRFYKYNLEKNAIYYCEDNIIIKDNKIDQYDKEKFILMENYMIDLKNKIITDLTGVDGFFDNNINNISKIEVKKNKTIKAIEITEENFEKKSVFYINSNNSIIGIDLPNVTTVNENFLNYNINAVTLKMENVTKIENGFLFHNKLMREVDLPLVEQIEDNFLFHNTELKKIDLPKLEKIGNYFIKSNLMLSQINLPNVKEIADNFLSWNEALLELDLPSLKKVGNSFVILNKRLTDISLDKLTTIGDEFLRSNQEATNIYLPSVREIGMLFMCNNKILNNVALPEVEIVKSGFCLTNQNLKTINFKNLKEIGYNFLYYNKNIETVILPNVKIIGDAFLFSNEKIKEIEINSIEKIGSNFMKNSYNIKKYILLLQKTKCLKKLRGIVKERDNAKVATKIK